MGNLIEISKQTYINPDKIIFVYKEKDFKNNIELLHICFQGSPEQTLTFIHPEEIDFAEKALGIQRVSWDWQTEKRLQTDEEEYKG